MHGLLTTETTSSLRKEARFVSHITVGVDAQKDVPSPSISAHSAVAPIGHENIIEIANAPTNPFDTRPLPEPLPFHDFATSIIPRQPIDDASLEEREVFHRIVSPYNVSAFFIELGLHELSHRFPLLVRNLTEGFHLGNMPSITSTVIIPNHSSVAKHAKFVEEYFLEEEKACRISGPYTQAETERILGGSFICISLIVTESSQGPNKPPKLRICSNASKGGFDLDGAWVDSVNSFVEKEKFPTTFDSASMIADWVSS
jgi:hypothetical protein